MSAYEKIKLTVLSGGIEEAAYSKIENEMMEVNWNIVRKFSLLVVTVLAILFTASLFVDTLAPYTVLYGVCFALSLVIALTTNLARNDNRALMLTDMYLFAILLLGLGIALGTFLNPKEISATFIALLLTVPQVFVDRPWRMYILIVVSSVSFIILTVAYKDPATWTSDITNALVFGLTSIVLCTYSICTKVERWYLEYKIKFLAENDQLTGLKNRYSYQQSLDNAAVLNSSTIYCVYVDVNGLHELNNSQGHEAGDRMLQYVASVMQHLFGEDSTYRIGGDEFVALGLGKEREELERMVTSMKSAVETAGYHIAVGISIQKKKEIEVNSIVKEAELGMYADKAEYYRRAGIDRRR